MLPYCFHKNIDAWMNVFLLIVNNSCSGVITGKIRVYILYNTDDIP